MNSKCESRIQNPRFKPQNAEFTTLASEELETFQFISLCFIKLTKDRICRAWTQGSQVDCLNFKKESSKFSGRGQETEHGCLDLKSTV